MSTGRDSHRSNNSIHGSNNDFKDLSEIRHRQQVNGYQNDHISGTNRTDTSVTFADENSYQREAENSHDDSSRIDITRSSDNLIQSADAPRDEFRIVCIGFVILGITTLLPWNFFITAIDYWMYKFRNVTNGYDPEHPHNNERTPMQTFFESYLAIAANAPMLVSMLLNSVYGQRFSQKKRLYISLFVMLAVFATTTLFVNIDTDHMQGVFFALTMTLVVIITFFSAIFQAAIFGLVAAFPNHYMHVMVTGQALAGLLAVTVQMISMISNSGPLTSGLWYFMASTIFLLLAIISYWFMDNDYSRYYLLKIPDEEQLSTSLSVNIIESKSQLLETLQDCWQMAATVVLTFWASLAVFPGICVLIVPEHPHTSFFTGRFFTPITTFFLFNLSDLAGRACSGLVPFSPHRRNTLLFLTVGRFIIPLMILFCNVQPRYNTPVLFKSDLFFPIFNCLSALTNGYIFSSAMVMASQSSSKERLELTGFIMASALGLGLTLGSVSSNILLRII